MDARHSLESIQVMIRALSANFHTILPGTKLYITFHYLIVIISDLKKFFDYESVRQKPSEGFVEDVFDGTHWKWFKSQMLPGQVFIGLNFCLDGALHTLTNTMKNGLFYPP